MNNSGFAYRVAQTTIVAMVAFGSVKSVNAQGSPPVVAIQSSLSPESPAVMSPTMADLRNWYAFDPGVSTYLRRHLDLVSVLAEGATRIRDIFGPARLSLRRSPSDRKLIYIVIATSLPVEQSVAGSMKLLNGWYVGLPVSIQERLNFTEEADGV